MEGLEGSSPITWAPWSPDRTPLHFFFWEHVTDAFNIPPLPTILPERAGSIHKLPNLQLHPPCLQTCGMKLNTHSICAKHLTMPSLTISKLSCAHHKNFIIYCHINFVSVTNLMHKFVYLDNVAVLYMFWAVLCSSSGGQIVCIQHMVSPNLHTAWPPWPLIASDDTICCIHTIWPPEDEHNTARNM